MTIRMRIAVMLTLSLVLAGSVTLVVNAIAFRETPYPTWQAYRDALLNELRVDRETAVRHIRDNPEILFETPGDTRGIATATTIDQAAEAVQRRANDEAVARSRRWTMSALLAVTVGAVAAGWVLSGRILRPVRLITTRARAASAFALDQRVSLGGPDDEIKELADTFDRMLDRLSLSFQAQRRFSGQVAHELRTPLATSRSEIEMLLADARATDVRSRLAAVANATVRAERLVAQLLVLSRTDTRDLDRASFALDELVGNVVGRAVEGPPWHELDLDLELGRAQVVGDRPLLESLVRNLVENAGRHNVTNGWARVAVASTDDGHTALLEVTNSAPTTARATDERPPGAANTGLTIVAAVLEAHNGTMTWSCMPGQVTARVTLPTSWDPADLLTTDVAVHA